jgi:hypothetical protein
MARVAPPICPELANGIDPLIWPMSPSAAARVCIDCIGPVAPRSDVGAAPATMSFDRSDVASNRTTTPSAMSATTAP